MLNIINRTCSHCKIQYIGETVHTLRARIDEHMGYIRSNNDNKTTGQHFQQHSHNMKVTILHVLKYEGETMQPFRCINSFYSKSNGLNNKY